MALAKNYTENVKDNTSVVLANGGNKIANDRICMAPAKDVNVFVKQNINMALARVFKEVVYERFAMTLPRISSGSSSRMRRLSSVAISQSDARVRL